MAETGLRQEISELMDYDEFTRVYRRLEELRGEEEAKLRALAELQKVYLSANSDEERDLVKQTVGDIRELSRAARQEIRALNDAVHRHMTPEQAREFYERWRNSEDYKPK